MAIGSLMLLGLGVVMAGCPGRQQGTSEQRSAGRPSRLALYGWGLATGCTKVDLHTGRIDAIQAGDKSVGTQISADELGKLRRLLEAANLRDFSPKAEWFERGAGDPPISVSERLAAADWSYSLVIWWEDERIAFHMPLEVFRRRVPEQDQVVYAKMDDIAESMMAVRDKYLGSKKARPADERTIKQLHSEMSEIATESLPKRR